MKKGLFIKIISVILVIATLFTALPMTVFAEENKATGENEVYIKDVKLQQAKDKETARGLLEGEGYIFLDRNLNEGTGADGIWLGYTTTTDPTEAIYDMKLMNTDGGYTLTSMEAALESQKSTFTEMARDLNYLVEEFIEAYEANTVAAQKAYMALNFFRVVDGEGELDEENGLGYQIVNRRITIEKLTEMILFCDGTILDSIVKILTMGIQLRTENWLDRLSALGPYDSEKTYGENETELKRRAKQLLVILKLYAQSYNAMDAMGLFNENKSESANTNAGSEATPEQKEIANVDIARVDIYKVLFGSLEAYTYGAGNLKEFFLSLENETNEKALYPLVSILTDGEFGALSYGCFMEMTAGAETTAADFENYDDNYNEVTKDVSSLYIFAGVNSVLLEDDTVVGFTDSASRQMALTGEYQFYEKESWSEDVWEAGRYTALGIEFVGLCVMIGAKATLGFMAITGALAAATAKGAVGILAGVAKLCTFIGGTYFQLIVLVIALTVALITYIIHAIDKEINGQIDWEKNPIPEYMYDVKEVGFASTSANDGIATEYMKRTAFVFYEVVRDINDNPVDMNAHSKDSSQWIAMYVSYDRPGDDSKPIKAKDLKVTTGNGETPEGYTPLSRFGEVRAYNLNQWDDTDKVNGLYVFYQQDQSVNVKSNKTYYIYDVVLQSGKSDTHCISLLEAAGYTPLNVNLSPDYRPGTLTNNNLVYTYLGYKVTTDPKEALTDIRIEYGSPQATVQHGGVTYAASGSSAGVTLYATKYSEAGTPILVGLICVDDRGKAPEGFEPVNFFAGGPAASFSITTDGITIGMKDHFIYFLPETTFTSGDEYLGGIGYYYSNDTVLNLAYSRDYYGKTVVSYMKSATGIDYPVSTKDEIRNLMIDYGFYRSGYHASTSKEANPSDSIVYYTTHNPYRAIYDIKGTDIEEMPIRFVFEGNGYSKWNTIWWMGGAFADSAQSSRYLFNFRYNGQGFGINVTMNGAFYVSGNTAKDNVYDANAGAMTKAQPLKMSDVICLVEGDDTTAVSGSDSAYKPVTDLFDNASTSLTVNNVDKGQKFNLYVARDRATKPYVSAITAADALTLYRAIGGADAGISRSNITEGMLLAQLAGQGATHFADLSTTMYGKAYWTYQLTGDTYRKLNTMKFGYTRTDDVDKALRDIFFYFGGFSTDSYPYEIYRGDVRYTMICEIPMNLTGYDGAPGPKVYVYGTTDTRAGEPITDVEFSETPFKEGYVAARTQSGRSLWSEISDYMENQQNSHFMSGAKNLFKKLFNYFRMDINNSDVQWMMSNIDMSFYILTKQEGRDLVEEKPYISELYLPKAQNQYYGSLGAKYDLKIGLEQMFDQGAEFIVDADLNYTGTTPSSPIYLGYSRTADPTDAITEIRAKHNGVASKTHNINGVIYNLVSEFTLNNQLKADTIYLYYTKSQDPSIGSPIADIIPTYVNTPTYYTTDSAEVLPVMRWDKWQPSNFNGGCARPAVYLSVVRPFERPMGSYEELDFGDDKVYTRRVTSGKAEGAYIAEIFVMDKNTLRQEKLAAGVPSDQCTCDKITDKEVFDRLTAMGATTIINTPIHITGEEYKNNTNKVFIGYSRTDKLSLAIKNIVIQTEVLSTVEPAENIYIKNDVYDLVAEAAKKVTELPRAINLIGTQDGQDLVAPGMYLYTSTEGKSEPIREIYVDNKAMRDGWVTVRSSSGVEPFLSIYEKADDHATLGSKDDSDSKDHELVYTDELYKWMEKVASMFNPKDNKLSAFYIHCKKYDGNSIEDTLPYIGKLYVAEGKTENEALAKLVAYGADGFVDCDLNRGAGGNKVYMAYKRTDNRTDAITELAIFAGKNPVDSKRISIGNNLTARFDLVAHVDLNSNAGGDWLYLYATTSADAGEPIRSLRIDINTVSSINNGFTESTVRRADDTGFTNHGPDLNKGAGGDYLYLIAKRGVPVENESSWHASLFGDGSLRAIFVLVGVAAIVGMLVYSRRKESERSDKGSES